MRVSQVCLLGLVAPVVTWAFLPQSLQNNPTQTSLRNPGRPIQNAGSVASWSQDDGQCSFTQMNMAFKSDQPSNIFDGPMALTKERDACGVGFIANTKEGGKKFDCEGIGDGGQENMKSVD
jgi:hypothetical protein